MFKSVVVLKKKPHYVMAVDESDAIEICSKYGPDVVGVFSSEDEIAFKEVKQTIQLVAPEIKFIEDDSLTEQEEKNVSIFKEVLGENTNLPQRHSNDS